jgi:CHAT domain-containing protein
MPGHQYANFDILLESVRDQYEVKVLSSPVGESPTRMFEMPISDLELRNLVLELRNAPEVVRDISTAAPPAADLVRDVGARLFDSLFRDQILSCLHRSIDNVKHQHDAGLRIRLHFSDAPELARLPWEMLYDHANRNFLGLVQLTPIIRYIELPRVSLPPVPRGPLRMLVLVSSPVDYPPLDVDHELTKLAEATDALVRSGRLVVEALPEPTMEALEFAGRQPYHLLHYVGHGGVTHDGKGVLVFCDSNGRGQFESGVDLGQQLADADSLGLVVLNSCRGVNVGSIDPFGGTAESLVLQGVPAVVAMQFEITDRAALKFSQSLYEALAAGRPVDAAVTQARRTLHAAARAEWATPVLYMRAPDGRLFDPVPERPVSPTSLPETSLRTVLPQMPSTPRPEAPPRTAAPAVPPPPPLPPQPPPASAAGSTALALSPLGILTVPLPFLVWAIRTGRRDLWLRTAIYVLGTIGLFAIPVPAADVASAESEAASTWLGFGSIILITVAIVDAFRIRKWVAEDTQRRLWARTVAAQDPDAAAAWRLGRPDLTGGRPDGGLVDVNGTSAVGLRRFLGLSRAEARRVEVTRARMGGLRGPDDLVTEAGIPRLTVDREKDRLLFLRPR